MPLTPQEKEVQIGYSKWLQHEFSRRHAGTPAFLIFNAAVAASWRRLGLRASDRLLDIGCGTGTLLCFLTKRLDLQHPAFGIDLTPEQVELAQRFVADQGLGGRVIVQTGSALNLPFADGSFDVVISSHLLHNVSDANLPQLLAEALRVLRPGGRYLAWAFGHDWSLWSSIGKTLADFLVRPPEEVSRNTWPRPFRTLEQFSEQAGFTEIRRLTLRPWLFPPTPRVGIKMRKPGGTL